MPVVSMTVNGTVVRAQIEDRTLLVDFLREIIGLTGTRIGCDTSQCGACTVHVGHMAIKSCAMFAIHADGKSITTIEGIGSNGVLHPMQEAFSNNHALQCGFCTPGMVMTALALVKENSNITESGIRFGLEGNLCRCTGYQNIVKAILDGAKAMRETE